MKILIIFLIYIIVYLIGKNRLGIKHIKDIFKFFYNLEIGLNKERGTAMIFTII